MPLIDEIAYKKHLSAGDFSPVYVLYGKEKFTLKNGLRRLLNKCKPSAFEEFNYNEFRSESTVDEIADAALNLPFMAEHKCVVVSDFDVDSKNAAEINKLNDLFDNLSESTILIFVYPTLDCDEKKSAKWKKFFKLAESLGTTVAFQEKSRGDLVKYISTAAEKYGSGISRYNGEKIIDYCGTDLNTINNELHKLCSYAAGREITVDDIDEVVTRNTQSRIYELSKAIISDNSDLAYNVISQLFYQREKPQVIFAALSKTYVDMYRAKIAVAAGLSTSAVADYDPASYKGRDFILRNAARDSQNISIASLRKSLDVIMETDMKLKGSKAEEQEIIEELVAKLLLIPKR